MCPRNRDRSLKCGTPRSPKPIVSAVSTPPPCPPSAASTSDLPPLSCPAPTISTPRSRRHRAQKLSRKDQRARAPRSCHLTSSLETRKGLEASRARRPILFSSLDHPHSPHSSQLSLTSFFSSPTPLVCPSTCLPLPPGRATAPRTTSDEAGAVVVPGRAEQKGFVLRHLVAEHP